MLFTGLKCRELLVPEPQRVFSLRPIGIEVVGSGNAFLGMVQEGLSDLVANPQAGDVSPPRPPEIVGPDVLQAGDLRSSRFASLSCRG